MRSSGLSHHFAKYNNKSTTNFQTFFLSSTLPLLRHKERLRIKILVPRRLYFVLRVLSPFLANKMFAIPHSCSWYTSSASGMVSNVRCVIAPIVSSLCYALPPLLRLVVVWLVRVFFLSIVGLTAWITTFQRSRFFVFISIFLLVGSVVSYIVWCWRKTNRYQKAEEDKWWAFI